MYSPHNVTEQVGARTRKELFLGACRNEQVERVPVWMMRQAGRYLPEYRDIRAKYSFLEVCKTPELAVEVSLQPFRRFGMDAVIVFSDILIPAEAMGMKLELTDAGPKLPDPVRGAVQVEALRVFDPERETSFLMRAIRQLCHELGPAVPVLGFAAAPWTLACYMIEGQTRDGFATAKRFLYEEPRVFRALLEKIARVTAEYLKAQIAAGAAAVQLFDTWCGELSLHDYEKFALPATQQVIEALGGQRVPVILYSKSSHHLTAAIAKTRATVLSVDWRMSLRELRSTLGPGVALQGNVDPVILLSSPEMIQRTVRETIAELGGRGHILNLGHGILPNTPVENAHAFIEAAQTTVMRAEKPAVPAD